MSFTITHTHEEGTLIHGTAKGDGSADILKRNGWRWGRSIGAWFVPMSRDNLLKRSKIDATRAGLEAAGFAVNVEVSTEVRNWAEVEAGKRERQAARVDALNAKAARLDAADDAAYSRARDALASLPEGGEPIKIGHHSEGRHRRGIERADRAMRASVEAGRAAEKARARADAASHTTDARYAPATVARRIEKLQADGRKLARSLATSDERREQFAAEHDAERVARYDVHVERLRGMAEENAEQVAYWQSIRAQQVADGTAGNFTPDTIAKGDLIRYRFADAAIVSRVNAKTVTVNYWPRWDVERMHTDTVAYGDLKAHTAPTDEQRIQLLAKVKEGAAQQKAAHAAAVASLRGGACR